MPAFENLRIHMVHGENSKTAAFVSCKIITEAGALFLNSMALVRGANGLYLSFPSRKREGQPVKGFEDYYYMERGLKELVQANAIEEFRKRCEELGVDAEKACAPLPPGQHGSGDEDEDREFREHREPREGRDGREAREGRDGREGREGRDAREPRQPREPREPREGREPREPQTRQPFRNESRPVTMGNGYDYRGGGGGGGYRGGNNGGGGGYRDRGAAGNRGDDFGNRVGYRGYDDGRNGFGFPTGANLANRPLSSRFNPYTGIDGLLQPEKPGSEPSQPSKAQGDEGEE